MFGTTQFLFCKYSRVDFYLTEEYGLLGRIIPSFLDSAALRCDSVEMLNL